MTKTISEYGIIRKASDYETPEDSYSEIFVSDRTFLRLKEMAFSSNNELIFSYLVQKGKEQIRVKNYVGLIQTPDHLQIEILPKSTSNSVSEARKILLKLLRVLPNSPYQSLSPSYLAISHLPLFEIFVRIFLDSLEKLLSQGLGRNYETIESNEVFIKGKVLVTENIRKNLFRHDTFFVSYTDFRYDIPQNRVIKSCLQVLERGSYTNQTKRRILQNLLAFEEVSFSKNIEKDLSACKHPNRGFNRYEHLINWAKIFLNQQSFLPFAGIHSQMALLFPMEILFENYVGKLFRKYLSDAFTVRLQDREKHLIDKHLENPRFRLIPDIVLEQKAQDDKKRVFIFDTKWKLIDNSQQRQHYGIEQIDLYQLYAYGKKYGSNHLFLIYPTNENFNLPLQVFDYEDHMTLQVLPFDLLNEGELEIKKLMEIVI